MPRAKAFLDAVPVGSMLILDLYSDGSPQWNRLDSYFGHHWVWNSLIVFGGRRGIYGTLDSLASSPYADRNLSASLVGVGVTPEAIDMSQPAFDITYEAGWRSAPVDAASWLQAWAVRRYGGASPSMAAAYALIYDAALNDHCAWGAASPITTLVGRERCVTPDGHAPAPLRTPRSPTPIDPHLSPSQRSTSRLSKTCRPRASRAAATRTRRGSWPRRAS